MDSHYGFSLQVNCKSIFYDLNLSFNIHSFLSEKVGKTIKLFVREIINQALWSWRFSRSVISFGRNKCLYLTIVYPSGRYLGILSSGRLKKFIVKVHSLFNRTQSLKTHRTTELETQEFICGKIYKENYCSVKLSNKKNLFCHQ